jgi:hypothetical protein
VNGDGGTSRRRFLDLRSVMDDEDSAMLLAVGYR